MSAHMEICQHSIKGDNEPHPNNTVDAPLYESTTRTQSINPLY